MWMDGDELRICRESVPFPWFPFTVNACDAIRGCVLLSRVCWCVSQLVCVSPIGGDKLGAFNCYWFVEAGVLMGCVQMWCSMY